MTSTFYLGEAAVRSKAGR